MIRITPGVRPGLSLCLALATVLLSGGCTAGSTSPLDPGTDPSPPGPPPPPPASLVYQFGAKYEPPVGRVVHGVGQWAVYNATYAAALPAGQQPASELLFLLLGDNPRPWDPAGIGMQVQAIHARGRVPSLDLALRGNQPTPAQLQQMTDKLYGIDDDVAHTTQYDGRIRDLAQVLRAYGHPVFLRIGGEFNGSWNGYHAYDYPVAFRKIVTLFRPEGASNVAFVWCYEPAAPGDFAAVDPDGNARWYPGPDVIDWFAIDLFAAGDVSGPLTGNYGRTLAFLDLAVQERKPVVIAESSPSKYDLSQPAQAEAAWQEWFTPYLALLGARPEIKWFHLITYDWTQAGYYQTIGWQNNDVTVSPVLLARWTAVLADPRFLHLGGLGVLNGWPGP